MPIKDLRNTTETRINRIDQATYESEQEMANGAEAIDAEVVLQNWKKAFWINTK